MSKGLFHQAVAMSGSPFKPKLLDYNMTDIAKKQASYVNCTTDNLDRMFRCLRKVPAQEFASSLSKFNVSLIFFLFIIVFFLRIYNWFLVCRNFMGIRS